MTRIRFYWGWVAAAIAFRLLLICFPQNLNLGSRPEVATPLTRLRRLAEGYWLKQSSMSPYAVSKKLRPRFFFVSFIWGHLDDVGGLLFSMMGSWGAQQMFERIVFNTRRHTPESNLVALVGKTSIMKLQWGVNMSKDISDLDTFMAAIYFSTGI